jgi:hypothetical protein
MAKLIPRQWLEVRLYKERDQVGVAGNDELGRGDIGRDVTCGRRAAQLSDRAWWSIR